MIRAARITLAAAAGIDVQEVTNFEKGSETRAERHINYCRPDGRRGLFHLSLLFGGA